MGLHFHSPIGPAVPLHRLQNTFTLSLSLRKTFLFSLTNIVSLSFSITVPFSLSIIVPSLSNGVKQFCRICLTFKDMKLFSGNLIKFSHPEAKSNYTRMRGGKLNKKLNLHVTLNSDDSIFINEKIN